MLLGREPECRRIEALVDRTAQGASGVLVIRGEPGIGKTALLEHAAAVAGSATVLRVRGVESEVELAFAGLHELLRPVLGELGRLPAPQRAALEAALGLRPAAAAERHLVFAARRLLADAVAVLLAVRPGEGSAIEDAGLEVLELGGLAAAPARALLE